MKSSAQPQILISPIPKQQLTEEDDELPNPMLDSIISQKSQSSYPGLGRQIKLKLNSSSNRSDKRKDPFKSNYQVRNISQECKNGTTKNQYKQIDSLFPLLKLVQLNQRQNKTECFNGEEVTIDQKVYFIKTNEILNIFQKAAEGFTIAYEEVEGYQGKSMNQSVSISEKMMKSMKAIKTFKKAKNKIKSFILVSEVSKYNEEEIKYKQQVDKINLFFNDNSIIQKSDHQLGEQIIKTKQQSLKKEQIGQSQFLYLEKAEPSNHQAPKRFSNFIENSKTILKRTSYVVGVFLLIFVMAYIKTVNGEPNNIEDL
ncbi:unnamed protein product (macronuclear) [Paramecium tetraurelia]|uniref:Transmembrane protein n=1 Tax=Paramecium tetraurelia TaxID=5888 RepID=A0DYF6_PARTE|nr:uncharacterized protein GSPATT00003041001 [Paramecium tetraurelia]CAK88073.1 unnamed protein product [Paramecium tetraurelia]|eukprot:XP_001455470.1 hypothetical protein (macronuclear) [Paramecium tetraurelia strain d4-2]